MATSPTAHMTKKATANMVFPATQKQIENNNARKATAATSATPPAAPATRINFAGEAPMTIDFGDINADPNRKTSGMRRTLLAGETGGYNPATGVSMLGGRRSLLG